MKNFLGKFLFVVTLAMLAGCGKHTSVAPRNDSEPVLAVIRTQTDALNREDVNAMMNTIDPSSPAFGQTRTMSEKLFEMYDLRYTIKEMKVESITGDTARVRVKQLTEKIKGPGFQNNLMEAVHTLKKHDGQWKVFSTEMVKMDKMD